LFTAFSIDLIVASRISRKRFELTVWRNLHGAVASNNANSSGKRLTLELARWLLPGCVLYCLHF